MNICLHLAGDNTTAMNMGTQRARINFISFDVYRKVRLLASSFNFFFFICGTVFVVVVLKQGLTFVYRNLFFLTLKLYKGHLLVVFTDESFGFSI